MDQLVWKIAVSGRMGLVEDMAKYVNREMMPNNLDLTFSLLYLTWSILLHLNPEVQRFAYSGMRHEDFEGTPCSSPLGEASVAAYRLTSVWFFTQLEWITWWIRPRRWYHSPVEGLGVSEVASIPCTDPGSSAIPLNVTWGSDPGGRSWGPIYRKSSLHASLGRGML